jgi:hypothetical protein
MWFVLSGAALRDAAERDLYARLTCEPCPDRDAIDTVRARFSSSSSSLFLSLSLSLQPFLCGVY